MISKPNNFWGNNWGSNKFGGKYGGVPMIYDVIASSIFAPREPSSQISESFIVIGSAIFEKPAINNNYNKNASLDPHLAVMAGECLPAYPLK